VDRQAVMLGSRNPLSQVKSREVMVVCCGAAFAEGLLGDLHVEEAHGHPPAHDQCGRDFEVWRSTARRRGTPYFWRCTRAESVDLYKRQSSNNTVKSWVRW
jgi:hypothetical protein